jgi:dihydrofolate reductase
MSLVRVHNFSISLDGFGTGEGQSHDAYFGHAGDRLHQWLFATRWWHTSVVAGGHRDGRRQPGGSGGVDDAFAQQHGPGIGAEIMGAGKFGPPGWHEDPEWKGAWGPNPPFHTPTFILTHHPRPSIKMEGGTAFHYMDASPAEALEAAREAAGGQDVRIGGGPTTIREFLAAGLVDHMHLVVVPILLEAYASGTEWRASRRTTRSRPPPRPAKSPMRRSPVRLSEPHRLGSPQGEVPKGMHVYRRWRNPNCCNPRHVFLGTDAESPRIPAKFGPDDHRPAARLTEALVREARELHSQGESMGDLAVRFGMDRRGMSRALRGFLSTERFSRVILSARNEMPYLPNCLHCPSHPPMSRKLFYNRGDPDALYGLVPITADRSIIDGVPPTPLRVFQCMFCGSLALFSQDHERDWELTAMATAEQAEQIVKEQQVLDDATPGNA